MIIKVNDTDYLELYEGTDIDVDRQSKLFESLDTTSGDFSYSFTFPNTSGNFSKLGIPTVPLNGKIIYKNIIADIIDDDGDTLYRGKLRVEEYDDNEITASFFSGNYNWVSLLSGSITDLDWDEYDTDLTESNIVAGFSATSGITFPLVDIGGLASRSTPNLKEQDFTGALYVKTIFEKIMFRNGIKFTGELLSDWVYNNAIILKNTRNDEVLEANKINAGKTSNQTVVNAAAYATIAFTDISNFPYYAGTSSPYSTITSEFSANFDMIVKVEVNLNISMNTQLNTQTYRINKTGSTFREYVNTYGPGANPPTTYAFSTTLRLSAGDTLKIDVKSTDAIGTNTGVQSGSTFKVTPLFVFKVYGSQLVPAWTQKDFILSVINALNIVPDWNAETQTVTFNLFDKIKTKTPVDLSQYIDPSSVRNDFVEFIANFGKNNYLKYTSNDDEDLRAYGVNQFVKYGNGVIEVDNDFVQAEQTIIESGFTTPVSYLNNAFQASMERVKLLELEEVDNANITSVTDSAGVAHFNIDNDLFESGDIVRIKNSSQPAYNGDWFVDVINTGYLALRGMSFMGTATAEVSKINFRYSTNDGVYLLINLPDKSVSDFSGLSSIELGEANSYNTYAYAYFNLLNTGKNINAYTQGLSFGEVDNALSYQSTLVDSYFRNVSEVLNDPTKIKANFYLPKSVYKSLTPLTPVYLQMENITSLFYLNRQRSYKDSATPCEFELIKL